MRDPNITVLIEVALDAAPNLGLEKRASLYRGLAEICGCPQQEASFLRLAVNFENSAEEIRSITRDLFPKDNLK